MSFNHVFAQNITNPAVDVYLPIQRGGGLNKLGKVGVTVPASTTVELTLPQYGLSEPDLAGNAQIAYAVAQGWIRIYSTTDFGIAGFDGDVEASGAQATLPAVALAPTGTPTATNVLINTAGIKFTMLGKRWALAGVVNLDLQAGANVGFTLAGTTPPTAIGNPKERQLAICAVLITGGTVPALVAVHSADATNGNSVLPNLAAVQAALLASTLALTPDKIRIVANLKIQWNGATLTQVFDNSPN